ncbi:MAG: asparagine synthase-related protein [Methylococcaceae bacterium]|jgi:asparagine synthase (glutamine-hydrolysing)
MSSIYGWFATQHFDSIINSNYIARFAPPDCQKSYIEKRSAALGGHGLSITPTHYENDKVLAIIDGDPSWQDSELATIANAQGAGRALAEGYAKYGKNLLKQIHGTFSFCLIEPDKNYALIAIDRLGIKPLAYYFQNGEFVFGSQLDQIIAHPNIKNDITPQALFSYLYFHMIPSPDTIYKAIYKLQPGEFVEVNDGKLNQGFYWQVQYTSTPLSKQQCTEQLHNQLQLAVKACQPNPQTGSFLSGGLDSSTVTGVYQHLSAETTQAFSIGFDAPGYDEMEYARATAQHFKVQLHEYYVTPADVLAAIPLIAQSYDEPFGNASAIPAYYCAKFARGHGMQQLLAGDGGDEIFAGNARYAKQKMFDVYSHVPTMFKHLLEPVADRVFFLKKLQSYIEQAKLPMPGRMETYNFLHRTPLTEIFASDFLAQIDTELPLQNLRQTYNRAETNNLIKKMLFSDAKFTLADNDLRKVNRMCELAGMAVKYPMLQENMIEFAASIPSNWLMQGFELRSFYRQAMQGFLAKATLNKSKQGFGLPFGVWMASHQNLKDFAEANLLGIEKRGFLNPAYIKNLIKLHQQGDASYYGVMIWLLIMLEQWLVTH